MNPFRSWWKPFAGLAFCLIYPSTAIFKKVDFPFLAIYCFVTPLLLWLAITWLVPLLRKSATPRITIFFLSFLFVLMLGSHLYIHPQIDTQGFHLAGKGFGASDADDAIDLAISEFLNGKYPYYAKTFLGNPITPMPGSLLLAFPFYFIGDSSAQNVFWLLVFVIAMAVHCRSVLIAAVLVYLPCFLSPNVIYHVLQGMDYISNAIYILTFSALLLETARRRKPFWQSALWAALLGFGLSSRFNFLLILPSVFIALAKTTSRNIACGLLAISLACLSAITLPFFIHDPSGFSPLHTSNKLSLEGTFTWAPLAVPFVAGLLALALAIRRKRQDVSTLMEDIFIVQAVVMVGAFFLASIKIKGIHFYFTHFGMLFMFFGVFAFGPACLIKSGALTIESRATSDSARNASSEPPHS